MPIGAGGGVATSGHASGRVSASGGGRVTSPGSSRVKVPTRRAGSPAIGVPSQIRKMLRAHGVDINAGVPIQRASSLACAPPQLAAPPTTTSK
jgi:hypothetical protein